MLDAAEDGVRGIVIRPGVVHGRGGVAVRRGGLRAQRAVRRSARARQAGPCAEGRGARLEARRPERRGRPARGLVRRRCRMTDSPVGELRLALTVEDFDKAVAFYRDTLGLPVEATWDNHGKGIVLSAGRATIELLSTEHAAYLDQIEVGRPAPVPGPPRPPGIRLRLNRRPPHHRRRHPARRPGRHPLGRPQRPPHRPERHPADLVQLTSPNPLPIIRRISWSLWTTRSPDRRPAHDRLSTATTRCDE